MVLQKRQIMLDPFEYPFFVRGILAATLVGGLCGMIGVYIVLKRMSYIGPVSYTHLRAHET